MDGIGCGRSREGVVVEERSCENGEMEEGGVAEHEMGHRWSGRAWIWSNDDGVRWVDGREQGREGRYLERCGVGRYLGVRC